MKQLSFFLLLLTVFTLSACGPAAPKKEIVAKVNRYEITRDRFEAEFKESIYAQTDTLEARKKFLENLIDRKLILQDAEAKGLDKAPDFLQAVEKFWEQSLLKTALDKKMKEIADAAAENPQVPGQPGDESQAVDEWVAGLRKNAHIETHLGLLK